MGDAKKAVNERSQELLQELYNNQELDFDKTSQILAQFRILTREKTLSPEVIDGKCIELLVNYSAKCHIEAQKCLSNLILNYEHLRCDLVDPYVTCVNERLNNILAEKSLNGNHLSGDAPICEVLYYDLRIIFLLSALCSGSRPRIREQLADKILQVTDREARAFNQGNYLLVIESLKTLFNLTLDKSINATLVVGVIKKLFSIVGTESDSFDKPTEDNKGGPGDQLLVNLIHLLTNMPEQVYLELSDDDVNKILQHLDEQLKTYKPATFRDTVLPVLNVCANICKYNDKIRQRWFDDIIGSAREFEKRPEEYDTLRGRLVKLMTSVDVHIKDIAAEFLHALCGGDTEKFITYTGFGNSAAFLSSRGLLSQGFNQLSRGQDPDSSMSDQEYLQIRHKLDPITGKLEAPKKNPMEGMSEEEKEWHANELAGAITKLTNLGVVRPIGVDDRGNLSELLPSDNKEKPKPNQREDDTE